MMKLIRGAYRACVALLAVSAMVSCGGQAPEAANDAESPSSSAENSTEGLFEVNRHELYVRCAGTGSPTVVFLHGADPELEPVDYSRGIEEQLSGDYRFCVYDRRNIGKSETVDGRQLPEDMVDDLDGVLTAADERGPYVLLGASFGGVLAYAYTGTHPEKVAGIVALDSMFPDELQLEQFVPKPDRYESYVASDEAGTTSMERIAHFKMLTHAQRLLPRRPGIPLTHLASKQEPRDTLGVPEYDRQIHDLLAAFVDRFDPGRLVWVDAPHFMEPAIPDVIAKEVRTLIEQHVDADDISP